VNRPRRLAALTWLVAALAAAPPAVAQPDAITGTELVALAQRAATDPAARAELLRVTSVDGRPVAVRAALAGARGDELERRARLLADAVGGAGGDGAPGARERAEQILDERRFHGAELPRPFEGPLAWIGDRLEPIAAWFDDLDDEVPGGPIALWTALAAACLLAAGGITSTTIRRRAIAIERARAATLPATEDPRALEREAEHAERAGEWERAVRLRFRAGLLRLDHHHVIEYRPSLTTGEVARVVESPAFAAVGARFDAIAYGGRAAGQEDAEAARRGWEAVLAEAAPR
jgi:Domain of unknown function (DUF4129)